MGALSFLEGAGLGAGIMYFFDPDLGHRRRVLLRDQFVHLSHQIDRGSGASLEDVRHRLQGVSAEVRAMADQSPVSDGVLVERVRARMGHLISHPGAIKVTAQNGQVTLDGPILAAELPALLAGVHLIPGVREVVNQLQAHETAGDVPGLQGDGHRSRPDSFFDQNWSPTTRLLVGTMGAGLLGYALGRRDPLGWLTGIAGVAFVTRAISNRPWSGLLGGEGGPNAVEYQKEIDVDAPLDQIFQIWTNVENFPIFMEHVLDVHVTAPGRTSWTIEGPLGFPVQFEAQTTTYRPNEELAWHSVDDAIVGNAGRVQFRSNPDGSTRITAFVLYTPPAGMLGNAVAAFLGDDPRQLLDDDLMRFKSLLESGHTTVRHHQVELAQLTPHPDEAREAMGAPSADSTAGPT